MVEKLDENAALNWQGAGGGAGIETATGGKDVLGLEFSGEAVLWIDNRCVPPCKQMHRKTTFNPSNLYGWSLFSSLIEKGFV